MMNCKQATRLMSEALDRPLSLSENMSLKLHVMMCTGCRNFGQHMHSLRKITRLYAVHDGSNKRDPD